MCLICRLHIISTCAWTLGTWWAWRVGFVCELSIVDTNNAFMYALSFRLSIRGVKARFGSMQWQARTAIMWASTKAKTIFIESHEKRNTGYWHALKYHRSIWKLSYWYIGIRLYVDGIKFMRHTHILTHAKKIKSQTESTIILSAILHFPYNSWHKLSIHAHTHFQLQWTIEFFI